MGLYKIASQYLTKESSFAGSAVKIGESNGKKILHIFAPQENLHYIEQQLLDTVKNGNHPNHNYYKESLHSLLKKDGVKLPNNIHEYEVNYHTLPKKGVLYEHLKNKYGIAKATQAITNEETSKHLINQFDTFLNRYKNKTNLHNVIHPEAIRELAAGSNSSLGYVVNNTQFHNNNTYKISRKINRF